MANLLKQNWDQLVDWCMEEGHKPPVLAPMGLGTSLAIHLESETGIKHRVSSPDLQEAIQRASIYLQGFANGSKAALNPAPTMIEAYLEFAKAREKVSSENHGPTPTTARILANKVLERHSHESDTMGQLARAVLALCATLCPEKK